jgi:hypothetical protein
MISPDDYGHKSPSIRALLNDLRDIEIAMAGNPEPAQLRRLETQKATREHAIKRITSDVIQRMMIVRALMGDSHVG